MSFKYQQTGGSGTDDQMLLPMKPSLTLFTTPTAICWGSSTIKLTLTESLTTGDGISATASATTLAQNNVEVEAGLAAFNASHEVPTILRQSDSANY